jgi:hypothetical protein
MEENCGGGQGLNWAVEPRRERKRENPKYVHIFNTLYIQNMRH